MNNKFQLLLLFSSICSVISLSLDAFDQNVLSTNSTSKLWCNVNQQFGQECCPFKPLNECEMGWDICPQHVPEVKYVCKIMNAAASVHCTGFIIDAGQLGLINHPRSALHGQEWPGALLITNSECVSERLGNCKNGNCPPIDVYCPFWDHCPQKQRDDGLCYFANGFNTRLSIEDFLDIGSPVELKKNEYGKLFKTDWPNWDKKNKHRAGIAIHHINEDPGYNGGGFELRANLPIQTMISDDANNRIMGYLLAKGNADHEAYSPNLVKLMFKNIGVTEIKAGSKTIPFQSINGNYKGEWGFMGAPLYDIEDDGTPFCIGVVLRPLVEVKQVTALVEENKFRPGGWGGGTTPTAGPATIDQAFCGYNVERIGSEYMNTMKLHLLYANGDPHMTTMDGALYHFMGNCEYYMIYAPNQEFFVSSKLGKCFFWPGGNIHLYEGGRMPGQKYINCVQWNKVRIHNAEVKWGYQNPIEIKILSNSGNWITITNPTLPWSNGELTVNANRVEVKSLGVVVHGYGAITVNLPEGFVAGGMLGTADGDWRNDFAYPNGTLFTPEPSTHWRGWGYKVPTEWGNAWRVNDPSSCSAGDIPTTSIDSFVEQQTSIDRKLAMKTAEEECAVIDVSPFDVCTLNKTNERDNCIIDVTECLSDAAAASCDLFVCEQLAAYAESCEEDGQDIDAWRSYVTKCPMQCPAGSSYQTCVDSCGYDCSSIEEVNGVAQDVMCVENTCVEGCQCADAKVLKNNVCVERSSC